jgi:hypothetical protein
MVEVVELAVERNVVNVTGITLTRSCDQPGYLQQETEKGRTFEGTMFCREAVISSS